VSPDLIGPNLSGKRVLLVGPAFMDLTLEGARVSAGDLERLKTLRSGDQDLVLVDGDGWEPLALAQALQVLAEQAKPPPVLLAGRHVQTVVVRNLIRLERSDVLEAPFTPDQALAAIAHLMIQAQPATTPTTAAACWAVMGAVGGAGATTLAVEMATALAARTDGARVCLIDLNLADGQAAAYLGAQPALRLADLPAERIDAAVLQAFATPAARNLDLLAAVRDPAAFDHVAREAVLRLMDVACEAYAHVVVDMPRHRRDWTIDALGGCDEVMVVSELTVPALLAARALAEETQGVTGRAPRIVLNRLASRMFGPAPSMAEAERALQRKADAGISSDWEAAAASVNLGGPIAQHRPKSKIVKDVAALTARLLGEARVKAAA
jgi:pilus assembly protein CpaE